MQEREQRLHMSIWEKTAAQLDKTGGVRVRDLPAVTEGRESVVSKQAERTRTLVAAATAAIANERRHERETMSEFIAKKREMFLVQMSLDTKREEIRKVRDEARCPHTRPPPRRCSNGQRASPLPCSSKRRRA